MSNDYNLQQRLNKIFDRGPSRWLTRDLHEDPQDFAALEKRVKDLQALRNQELDQMDSSPTVPTVPQEGDIFKKGPQKGQQKPAPVKQPGVSKKGKGAAKYFEKALKVRDKEQADYLKDIDREHNKDFDPQDEPAIKIGNRKKRKNPDNNYAEMVVAAALANPNARTVDDVLQHAIPRSNIHEPDKYIKNVQGVRDQTIENVLSKFHDATSDLNLNVEPEDVLLRGKQTKGMTLTPQELIKDLNAHPHRARADKADVLAQNDDGRYLGFSVKAQPDAWEGSYSINELLKFVEDKAGLSDESLRQKLDSVKRMMYRDAGYPEDLEMFKSAHPELTGGARDRYTAKHPSYKINDKPASYAKMYGELFEDTNNPYHKLINEVFAEYAPQVHEYWKESMFPKDLPYDLYKWDSENLTPIEHSDVDGKSMDWTRIENPRQREGDDSEKMFYHAGLEGMEDPLRRLEVRRKENPFNSHYLETLPWNKKHTIWTPMEGNSVIRS